MDNPPEVLENIAAMVEAGASTAVAMEFREPEEQRMAYVVRAGKLVRQSKPKWVTIPGAPPPLTYVYDALEQMFGADPPSGFWTEEQWAAAEAVVVSYTPEQFDAVGLRLESADASEEPRRGA